MKAEGSSGIVSFDEWLTTKESHSVPCLHDDCAREHLYNGHAPNRCQNPPVARGGLHIVYALYALYATVLSLYAGVLSLYAVVLGGRICKQKLCI